MSMDLVMSLLMETGSFDTDAKRSVDQLNKIEKAAKQLTKALSEGRPGAEDFVGPLQPGKLRPAIDGVENLNRSVQKSQAAFRGSNQIIQQTSYQVTDFIMQVNGGVDAVRAFGQQAPQLLGAFGAFGAAIGVFVALGAGIAPMIMNWIGASKSLEDTQKSLENALSNVSQTAQSFDMSKMVEQFNAADAVVRRGIINLIEYRKTAAELAAAETEKALQTQLKGLSEPGFIGRALGQFNGTDLGIDPNIAKNFFAEVRSGTSEASILAQKYGSELLKGNDTAKQLAATLNKVALDTQSAANASSAMSKFLSQAKTAGETGIIPTEKTKGDKTSATKEAKSEMDLYVESINKAEQSFILLGEKRQYLDSLKESLAPEVWEKFSQDLDKAAGGINNLDKSGVKLAQTFEQAFGQALQQGVAGIVDVLFEANKSFGEFAENFVKMIAKMITQLLILRAIEMTLSSFGFGSTSGSVATKSANGNVFDQGGIKKFASGGIFTNSIITKPTAFAYGGAFGSQSGLMGEAGPEAVMPLTRGRDGKLGVAASGIGGGGMAININVNNEGASDGYQASATARKNDTGIDIDIIVRKAINSDLQRNGPISQQISNTYNLRRQS